MNTIDAIMNRKSIRRYTDKEISEEDIHTILKAGMSGPTAVNTRDWHFVVVTDPMKLNQMADAGGRNAEMLRHAKLAVLVCGNAELAFQRMPEFWIIDCSAACQNMILAAEELGIGSCWIGTWPIPERMANHKALFSLPDHLIPHSIISFGYPAENPDRSGKPELEEEKITYYR
ncbi:MAG: nitroreductase family protein [Clostridia bacterium]|nr:nitroreductase family protein [Clostridia bacterium]